MRFSSFTCTTLAISITKEPYQARAQKLDLASQLHVLESVRARLHTHNDVDPRLPAESAHHVQKAKAAELSQAPFESVPFDRRVTVLRDDETDSGHGAGRKNDPQIEVGAAETLAVPHRGPQIATPSQSMSPS